MGRYARNDASERRTAFLGIQLTPAEQAELPRCNAAAPKPQIRAAYDLAYDSLTRAQTIADAGGTPDMVASASALSALQALVVQLPPT